MPDQARSPDGKPQKDADRPSPDVDSDSTDGQSSARGKGAGSEQGYPGDGPGKIGVTSDRQPDLVAPSGVNERDHGSADDKPMGGGSLNFDDDALHPRGNNARTGGTWDAEGGDAGDVGGVDKAPGAGLSDRNGPSDPDARTDAGRSRS